MIRAYPDRASVLAGEDLRLHVSTDARRFRVRFFRWGSTIEAMPVDSAWLSGAFAPANDAAAAWEWPAYDFAVPTDWCAGVYVAVLETDEAHAQDDASLDARSARALFTVRERAPHVPLLVVLPLFTYHAYNVADVDGTLGDGEGACLYSGAPWVSLHRPGGGIGGHPWDEVNADVYDPASPRQTFAHWDAKGVAWLEQHGYAFDCATDLELHDPQFDLGAYRALASFGHHEYWTAAMRKRLEAFIAAGGNVAIFGGNTCWFRAEYDEAKQRIRRAGRWTDSPEWMTTGVSYAFGGGKWIGSRPPSGYTVRNAQHWIFRGCNVDNGDCFGAQRRLVGYECDGAPLNSGLEPIADARIKDWPVRDGSGEVSAAGTATLGIRRNGGTVFTASTVDWARVLSEGEKTVQRITANVLDRLASKGL